MKSPALVVTVAGVAAALAVALAASPRTNDEGTGSTRAGAVCPAMPELAGRVPSLSPSLSPRAAAKAPADTQPPPAGREHSESMDPSQAASYASDVASEDASVRRSAVRALARIGGHGARLLLARAYENPHGSAEERVEIRDVLADLRRDRAHLPAGIPPAHRLGR